MSSMMVWEILTVLVGDVAMMWLLNSMQTVHKKTPHSVEWVSQSRFRSSRGGRGNARPIGLQGNQGAKLRHAVLQGGLMGLDALQHGQGHLTGG